MQKALAIISAAAGAIVGLVKLVGLITGSQWLGDNWKETLSYFAATVVMLYACYNVILAVQPTLLRRGDARVRQKVVDTFLPAGPRKPWKEMLLFGFIAANSLLSAALIVHFTPKFWIAGLVALVYALLFAVLYGFDQHQTWREEHTECPYCLQTIKVEALVCHHCTRDLTKDSLEAEDEDSCLIWL